MYIIMFVDNLYLDGSDILTEFVSFCAVQCNGSIVQTVVSLSIAPVTRSFCSSGLEQEIEVGIDVPDESASATD